ncbi:hypothetical protein OG203_34135 [Nocardia sp. NBC_01499]|uniref:hypothetical protein n=1 Tax=Nocardia sp. NBC_01499 TaxID=2903597 RepID=UPI00386D8FA7
MTVSKVRAAVAIAIAVASCGGLPAVAFADTASPTITLTGVDYVNSGDMLVTFIYNCAKGAAKGVTVGIEQTKPKPTDDKHIVDARASSKRITCDGTNRTMSLRPFSFPYGTGGGFEHPGSGTAYARIWNANKDDILAEGKGDFAW